MTKLSQTFLFAIGDFFSFGIIGRGFMRGEFSDPLPPYQKLSNASVLNIENAETRINIESLAS